LERRAMLAPRRPGSLAGRHTTDPAPWPVQGLSCYGACGTINFVF
jgi:hypothetical protein